MRFYCTGSYDNSKAVKRIVAISSTGEQMTMRHAWPVREEDAGVFETIYPECKEIGVQAGSYVYAMDFSSVDNFVAGIFDARWDSIVPVACTVDHAVKVYQRYDEFWGEYFPTVESQYQVVITTEPVSYFAGLEGPRKWDMEEMQFPVMETQR